jgi:transposase
MRRSWYGNWCDIGEGNATYGVWVRVPSPEDEDRRQLHRGLEVLKEERKQHRVRIQSLLFTQGIDVKVGPKFLANLEALRCWNKQPVAEQMRQRIQDEVHRLQLVEVQIRELKVQQAEQVRAAHQDAVQDKVRRLQQLMGVGLGSSWIFVMELFGWRQFQNRRELAAAVGLTPTPYNSSESVREQGISRSGNPRIRKLLIEIAWAWLRFQPNSKLSRWYNERFAKGGKRMRRDWRRGPGPTVGYRSLALPGSGNRSRRSVSEGDSSIVLGPVPTRTD